MNIEKNKNNPVANSGAVAATPPGLACRVIERRVASAFAIPIGELRKRRRCSASVALARQSAMYLAHVALGLNYTQVGHEFRRDRTTAAHACRVIEKRRDNPGFDAALCRIEQVIAESSCGRDLRTNAS